MRTTTFAGMLWPPQLTVSGCDYAAGVVRGSLDVGGWHLRPSPDGRSTRASYLFAIDIGGQVPQFIVNAGVSAQAMTIAVVRKVRPEPCGDGSTSAMLLLLLCFDRRGCVLATSTSMLFAMCGRAS